MEEKLEERIQAFLPEFSLRIIEGSDSGVGAWIQIEGAPREYPVRPYLPRLIVTASRGGLDIPKQGRRRDWLFPQGLVEAATNLAGFIISKSDLANYIVVLPRIEGVEYGAHHE